MAEKLGLKREWMQGNHYDIGPERRASAVALGAIQITDLELAVKHFEASKAAPITIRVYASAGTGNSTTEDIQSEAASFQEAHQEALEFAIDVTGFEFSAFALVDSAEVPLEDYFKERKND